MCRTLRHRIISHKRKILNPARISRYMYQAVKEKVHGDDGYDTSRFAAQRHVCLVQLNASVYVIRAGFKFEDAAGCRKSRNSRVYRVLMTSVRADIIIAGIVKTDRFYHGRDYYVGSGKRVSSDICYV